MKQTNSTKIYLCKIKFKKRMRGERFSTTWFSFTLRRRVRIVRERVKNRSSRMAVAKLPKNNIKALIKKISQFSTRKLTSCRRIRGKILRRPFKGGGLRSSKMMSRATSLHYSPINLRLLMSIRIQASPTIRPRKQSRVLSDSPSLEVYMEELIHPRELMPVQ